MASISSGREKKRPLHGVVDVVRVHPSAAAAAALAHNDLVVVHFDRVDVLDPGPPGLLGGGGGQVPKLTRGAGIPRVMGKVQKMAVSGVTVVICK